MNHKMAVVGAGLVGSSWAIVFSRAGLRTSLFERDEKTRTNLFSSITNRLNKLHELGAIEDINPILSNIHISDSLEDTLKDADYIQESVFETVENKTKVSLEIDALMPANAIVGSSSSGIPSSEFTEECTHRNRFLIAHPVNPPHLHRLVELVPSPWTDEDAVTTCKEIMTQVGQITILVQQEIQGFILNRLQGALLCEAWSLFEDGTASIEDIDNALVHGLVPRWSAMGPFETIDLNAPGGIKDYAERLGPLYHSVRQSRDGKSLWSKELIDRAEKERRKILPENKLAERSEWRDEELIEYAKFKESRNSRQNNQK